MKKVKFLTIAILLFMVLFNACKKDIEAPAQLDVFAMPPKYKQLWIVGDATPVGWKIAAPEPMNVDTLANPYLFWWEGELVVGELKIPTLMLDGVEHKDWDCDFYMPVKKGEDAYLETDLTLTTVELISKGTPDNKWKITEKGKYRIELNIKELPAPSIKFIKL